VGLSVWESELGGDESRRIRGTITKLASRRSEVVKAPGPSDAPKKYLDDFTLKGI
jgi:hypothetical protein